jgi:hypothetical protein
MNSRPAFEAIKNALSSDPLTRIVSADFSEDHFGNFVIAFSKEGVESSLVLDRGELAICQGLNGSDDCRTLLSTIYDVNEQELIAAVKASG